MQVANDSLLQWAREQAAAGHDAALIRKSVLQSGWSVAACAQALQAAFPGIDEQGAGVQELARAPEPRADLGQNRALIDGRLCPIRFQALRPRICLIDEFLLPHEREMLIEMAQARISRSTTVDYATNGGSSVNEARTSDGMFFQRAENPLVLSIETRIAEFLSWPMERGEGLQLLRYGPGAQYLPHYDYFDPANENAKSILARGGQRVGTLIMYLNDPEEGGATVFPEVGLQFNPKAGSALFFSYPVPAPESLSLHGGQPVIKGEKWIATKWLREGTFN